jgi:hypothetical protein
MKISKDFLKDLEEFPLSYISPSFIKELFALNTDYKLEVVKSDDCQSLSLLFNKIQVSTNNDLELLLSKLPEIHPLKAPFSLFSPMGYDRWEVAYTKTLAFLINHPGEMGMGACLFETLIQKVIETSGESLENSSAVVESVYAEKPIYDHTGKDQGRADIMVEFRFADQKKGLLFIEAKVDAGEGFEQLERYETYLAGIEDRFDLVLKVFLTSSKCQSKTNKEEWINLTFIDVLGCLEKVLLKIPDSMEKHYLAFFGSSILKDILGIGKVSDADQYAKYKIYTYLIAAGK